MPISRWFIGAAILLYVLQAELKVVKRAAATGDGAQLKLAICQLEPEYQAQLVNSPNVALPEAVQNFSTPTKADQ